MAVIRGGWEIFPRNGGMPGMGGWGWFDNGGTLYIVSRRVPPILWRLPPFLPTNFVQPHTPTYLLPPTRLHTVLSVALFLWLNGWSRHTQSTHHTQGTVEWHNHINIYLHHLSRAHSSYLCYIIWNNSLILKIYLPQCLFFSKIILL